MKNLKKALTLCAAGLLAATGAVAQSKLPAGTRNAALRYWQAFSELRDEQTDKATRELLERTAEGYAPWNEEKLGKILDANLHAIQIMQRATKLPECDWGLEATSDEPVGFVYKARVLARLDTLQGKRLLAKGDLSGAVNSWLAGVKFSQDLAKGGTLIFALVARSALLPNINALKKAGEDGVLDLNSRGAATATLASLPPTGFDWGATWRMETTIMTNGWESVLKADNPQGKYKELMNEDLPAGSRLPNEPELGAFRSFMDEVAAALRMPPADARGRLQALREREKTLNPLLQNYIPNFEKVNDNRQETQNVRDAAIKALGSK